MKPQFSLIILTMCIIILSINNAFAGYALEFDRDEYQRVEIPSTESLEITGEAFTAEAWVKPVDPPDNSDMIIINKENTYEMRIQGDRFGVAIRNQTWEWFGDGDDVEIDEWNHVAFTYDGDRVRMYVNGEETSNHVSRGEIISTDSSLCFASRPIDHDGHNFNGQIDEVRIWNVVRSEEELNETMEVLLRGDEEGLVGYWRLDEGDGQEFFDMTGNDNDGWIGAEEDEDDRDPQWVESEAPLAAGELELSTAEIVFDPLVPDDNVYASIELNNVSEEEDEAYTIDYVFSHVGEQPDWFAC